jgi:hypothetical protein
VLFVKFPTLTNRALGSEISHQTISKEFPEDLFVDK